MELSEIIPEIHLINQSSIGFGDITRTTANSSVSRRLSNLSYWSCGSGNWAYGL